MADKRNQFSEGLSATINASTPKELDGKLAIQSDSVTTENKNERGQIVQASFDGNEPDASDDYDLIEVNKAARSVDRFMIADASVLSDGEDEPPRVFSQDYEARKQKMLQTTFDWDESDSKIKPKRRFRIPAAVAAALAVIIVAASLTGANADAMPEPVRVLVMRMQSLFSSASVEDGAPYGNNQASEFPKEILAVYEPTMVLDGYKVSETISQSKRRIIYYKSENKKEYTFKQLTIDSMIANDAEEIDYETLTIGNQYMGITYIKNNERAVQWQQDKYVFEISGILEKEILESLAASVELVEE